MNNSERLKNWYLNQPIGKIETIKDDLKKLTSRSWKVVLYWMSGTTPIPPLAIEPLEKYCGIELDHNEALMHQERNKRRNKSKVA